mmetsp:Transcript_9740/g.22192  ORF Transcript_9740/g.22192 Transcript_9740/m.22192 type:complete len:202 (-) Transcript_9740:197-802(-)
MDRSFRFRERDRMDARSLAGGSWCAFGGSNRRGGLGFEFGGTRFQPRVALSPRTHGFRSQDRRELHEIDAAAAGAGDHVVRRGAPPLLRRDFPVRRNDLCVGWELAGFLEVSHHVANACQRDGTGSSAAVVVVVVVVLAGTNGSVTTAPVALPDTRGIGSGTTQVRGSTAVVFGWIFRKKSHLSLWASPGPRKGDDERMGQ